MTNKRRILRFIAMNGPQTMDKCRELSRDLGVPEEYR